MALFWVVWMIQYPTQIWRALTFQERETKTDIFVCCGVWVFLGGFVAFVTWMCARLA